jgi:uncharacterized membrane protein
MNETMFVNLALTVRVLLVGGFLLILPHIIRKGLLFGVYVGEDVAKSDTSRQLLSSWRYGCVFVMALSLFVGYGISLAGRPVMGNLTGTAVLLCSALALYLYLHSKARKLILPHAALQAHIAVASLDYRNPKEAGFAKLTLAICLIASLTTIVYAAVGYRAMPGQVPSLTAMDTLVDKSIITFLFFPCLNLVVSPFFALLALLTAGAKRALRDGLDSHSVEAQDAFRAINARAISWMALLLCILLSLLSVQITRVGLLAIEFPWMSLVWVAGGIVVFMAGFVIRIIKGYGQGGSFRELGSVKTPLTGSLADNAHWVWGLFYFNRDDPSMMIEKRFGFGFSFNYGNRNALLIVVTFLALITGIITLAIIGYLN